MDDAVANKVSALFSRGELRDYLDVDAIRRSGRYTDQRLLSLAKRADAGFDLKFFAQALHHASDLGPKVASAYGVTSEQLAAVKTGMTAWAASIRESIKANSARDLAQT